MHTNINNIKLRAGDIVVFRKKDNNLSFNTVFRNMNIDSNKMFIISGETWFPCDNDNFINISLSHSLDLLYIFRPNTNKEFGILTRMLLLCNDPTIILDNLIHSDLQLIYKKETKELTIREIEDLLGYNIKIIKDK